MFRGELKTFLKNNNHLEKTKYIQRTGIVPFFIENNQIFFLFGIDSASKDLTDFGGKKIFKDNDFIDTGIREAKEESLKVLDDLISRKLTRKNVINNSFLFTDYQTAIIFFQTDPLNMKMLSDEFQRRLSRTCSKFHQEMLSFVFLTLEQVIAILNKIKPKSNDAKFYSRIHPLLRQMCIYFRHVKVLTRTEKNIPIF